MLSGKEKVIRKIVKQSLAEDIGRGDITTFFSVSHSTKVKAFIVAKEKGILCGIDIARESFKCLDPCLTFKAFKKDSDEFSKNTRIARIKGKAVSILGAERVALNFLSLLSAISTHTKKFVEQTKGTKAKILDTRKTSPNLRILEKYAAKTGGAKNHRQGLWDGILIKDNHLLASGIIKHKKIDQETLSNTISILRSNTNLPIEIEVENMAEFKIIVKYKPDIVMLDNFSLTSLKKAVAFKNRYFPNMKLEASGGITMKNIKKIAGSGVDFISIGSLTHSPPSIDFSLEIADD